MKSQGGSSSTELGGSLFGELNALFVRSLQIGGPAPTAPERARRRDSRALASPPWSSSASWASDLKRGDPLRAHDLEVIALIVHPVDGEGNVNEGLPLNARMKKRIFLICRFNLRCLISLTGLEAEVTAKTNRRALDGDGDVISLFDVDDSCHDSIPFL